MKLSNGKFNRRTYSDEFRSRIDSDRRYLLILIAVLFYAFFVSSFDINLYFYASPFIVTSIGVAPLYIGISVSSFTFGVIISALLGGYAFNRMSIKSLFLMSLFTATAASVMTGLSRNLTELLTMRFLVGMGTGMLQGTIVGFIGMIYPKKRGFLISLTGVAFSTGLLIGPYSEAFIAPHYVQSFILSCIFGLAGLVLIFILVPNVHNRTEQGIRSSKRKMFNRNTMLLFFAIFSFGVGYFGFIGYFSHFLINFLHSGHYISALTASMLGIGGIILTLPFGHLSDRIGRKNILILLYGILAVTSFTMFYLQIPAAVLLASSFFFGGAYDALIIVTAAAAQDYTGSGGEGASSGLMYSFFYGGGIVGGSFFGIMLSIFGFRLTGVLAVSAFMVIGFVFSFFILPGNNAVDVGMAPDAEKTS